LPCQRRAPPGGHCERQPHCRASHSRLDHLPAGQPPGPVKSGKRLPLILAVVGLVEFLPYLQQKHGSGVIITELAGSLMLAVLLGALRAMTVRLFIRDGQLWRRGTWVTALLWLVSFGAHIGYESLFGGNGTAGKGAGDATIVLYLAVTYAVQRLVLQGRAQRGAVTGVTAPGQGWM
jgi:hypothetical protein